MIFVFDRLFGKLPARRVSRSSGIAAAFGGFSTGASHSFGVSAALEVEALIWSVSRRASCSSDLSAALEG
ncbi:hypothetical protein NPIL_687601 [Nephila pilipes]|uniref:Uncharacterized protein n=1 Tax=Nephila pilipes TaxID=299642 RepID=A0A8X6NAC2_NEPPI|nr:hypothetical protein NPIL_687601 [Nephila pilipes]